MEVYHNGEWGTVCDDGWDLNDAQVVCNELGLGDAVVATDRAFYGQGLGQIWLDELGCAGTEWTIRNCSHRGWGRVYRCIHFKDAGVKCSSGMYLYFIYYFCFVLVHSFKIVCTKIHYRMFNLSLIIPFTFEMLFFINLS